jgi:four helix bundle protein
MSMGNFRRLEVYKRAAKLADALHDAALRWTSFDLWTTGVQLVRAADSVSANIAEAGGRRSLGDERRFLFIARGSAFELEHWIETACRRGLLTDEHLLTEAKEVGRMLTGLLRARHRLSED